MLLKKTPVAVPCNAAACGSSAWADLPAPEPVGRGPSAETPNFSPPQAVICRWPQGMETKYQGCLVLGPGTLGNIKCLSHPCWRTDAQSALALPSPRAGGGSASCPGTPS